MAEVAIAACAEDLGADHTVGGVEPLGDVFFGDGSEEAWPTGVGFEFGVGMEEWEMTPCTAVDAGSFVVEEVAAERTLCALGAEDAVGFGREFLFPLGVW